MVVGLLTTTVGSFPKPRALRVARWRYAEGEIESKELRAAESDARSEVIRLQESLGLDLLVDGQMDRGDMITFFAKGLTGTEAGGLVRCFDNRYYRKPRVVAPIERTAPLTVEGWQAAGRITTRPVKAVLTGPYTLMDWSFDEHYDSREDCCMAFAEAIRAEAEDLAAAGAAEIQIDEPAISARPHEMDLAARALGRVTGNLRGRTRTWTHICYGEYAPVIGAILELPVDGVMLELANSGCPVLDALDGLPGDKLLGAGVVDVLRPEIETAGEIRERIERLLGKVPAERLWIMPDAGLRALTAGQARDKLEAMIRAAAELG